MSTHQPPPARSRTVHLYSLCNSEQNVPEGAAVQIELDETKIDALLSMMATARELEARDPLFDVILFRNYWAEFIDTVEASDEWDDLCIALAAKELTWRTAFPDIDEYVLEPEGLHVSVASGDVRWIADGYSTAYVYERDLRAALLYVVDEARVAEIVQSLAAEETGADAALAILERRGIPPGEPDGRGRTEPLKLDPLALAPLLASTNHETRLRTQLLIGAIAEDVPAARAPRRSMAR